MVTGVILAVVALGAILWAVGVYNSLIGQRNQVNNAWSQIDVQLQRRYDLIPNLVETAKGYMQFEKSTLQEVIAARNQAVDALKKIDQKGGAVSGTSMKELAGAEAALGSGIGRIFAVAEAYPDLKANQTMQNLQEELSSTENKVAFSRQAYNDQAMMYNTMQQKFPSNLLSQSFGHNPVSYWEVENQEAKNSVKVSF
jgi:LemA protein